MANPFLNTPIEELIAIANRPIPEEDRLKARQIIKQKLEEAHLPFSQREREKAEKVLEAIVIDRATPKEAMELTDKDLEMVYLYGYNLFKSGKYKNAFHIMDYLMHLNPRDSRYPLACAAACHTNKEYEKAIPFYMLCGAMAPENPLPFYYMYDCYMNLGKKSNAYVSAKIAVAHAGDNPEFSAIKARAEALAGALESEGVVKQKEEGV